MKPVDPPWNSLQAEPVIEAVCTPMSASHRFCALCRGRAAASIRGDMPRAMRVTLELGARLHTRGQRGEAIYVVQSGIVKETTPGPRGAPCIVRLAMRADVVGLCGLLGVPQHHSATVIQSGAACRVPYQQILALRAHDMEIVDQLERDWFNAVEDADRIMAGLNQGSGRSRMARALLYLRSTLATGEPLWLRRADLASLLAVTPVTVARLLREFKAQQLLVERDRWCIGIDVARLRAIAGDDRWSDTQAASMQTH